MTTAGRRARVSALLADLGVDSLVVSGLVNLRYLTGFSCSNGALVVGPGAITLVTDSRYAQAASRVCPDLPLALERDALAGALAVAAAGASLIGLEAHHVTAADWQRMSAAAAGLGVEVRALEPVVEPMRAVKDDTEVELLRTACAITETALARLLPEIRTGVSERWIAARLEYLMREEGAEAAAFPSIVATGSASAEPHHEPTDGLVAPGDLLTIDCGARFEGYHADMTRTFVVGSHPADWQIELHALVDRAAAAGRTALRSGAAVPAIDESARALISEAGHGERFGHGLGHGVGLEIHEAPMINARAVGTLSEQMTVTVEPGVYLPDLGGVRIEDTLVVTSTGSVPLTTMSRELLVLG